MNCPRCGAWTEVLETRTKQDNTKRRRYQCANLHRFTTIELINEKVSPEVPQKKSSNFLNPRLDPQL